MALELVYAKNIRIIAQYRSGRGDGVPVDAEQELQRPFLDGTSDVLDRAADASNTFRTLLNEVRHGQHGVNIYMARSKKKSLGTGIAETNRTADTVKLLPLARVEGTDYASSRAGIAVRVCDALEEVLPDQLKKYKGDLQRILAPEEKTAISQSSFASWIRKNVASDRKKRQELEKQLAMGVKIVQEAPAPTPKKGRYGRVMPATKPFDCEVYPADDVYAPAIYYLPLWQELPNKRLHLEDALAKVPEVLRREKEKTIRTLLGNSSGPLDAPFLRDAEVKNRKWYLRTKLCLEPYLTPGDGCDSNIVFNLHAKRMQIPNLEIPKLPKDKEPNKDHHPWHIRPVEVGLAHEMIHAWRNSSGRTIFGAETFEDEAMVIGDPLYTRAFPRFNENQIRHELNLALRPENTRKSMFSND